MDLTNILTRIKTLEKLVKELICKSADKEETDPTVPFYVKELSEKEVVTLKNAVAEDIGTWDF